ncbi:MAG: DUF1538 family protein [Spirochaetota bacterium]
MEKVHLSFKEQMRLVIPYAYHNIKEQALVVVPVCLYIVLFQLVILRYSILQTGFVIGGIVLVFIGLAFFLEGIRIGLAPIGEIVGNNLPKSSPSIVVLIFAFMLGILASFGEPVLGTLQVAASQLKEEHAPLLYMLLVGKPMILVGTVAFGVGVAVVIGTLRFLYGWSLKPIVLPLVLIGIVLTIIASQDKMLASAIGLAWDTGAVIVGPVLCPLVLALGVGVCRASGKMNPTMAGFGMVGLISVVPITAVIILTFVLYTFNSDLRAKGHHAPAAHTSTLVTNVGAHAAPAGHAAAAPATETHSAAAVPDAAAKEALDSAGAEKIQLPTALEFTVFYPRLRLLTLPSDLKYADYSVKTARLPAEKKRLFLAAYEVSDQHQSIKIKRGFGPEVRAQVPALLTELGYNLRESPVGIFERVYTVTVTDEKALKGSITLKSDVPPGMKKQVAGILASIGYMNSAAVLLDSLVLGVRAILPIFAFLFIVMLILRRKGPQIQQIILALVFAIIGLTLFFFGLTAGLGTLGNQMGSRMPAAFLDYLPLFPAETSLYPTEIGKVIVVIFAVILGYGATLAEPAFNVLGQQVEDVTQGAFKKNLFSQAVALGVGIGAGLGIVSLLYNINLLYLLLPPYVLLAILTVLNQEIFVNIAWDGGAVTTGPVTVPLKLALGLSLSVATGAGEGFGVLALASAYPVLNILLLGMFLGTRKSKVKELQTAE